MKRINIPDLLPDTTYVLRVRVKNGDSVSDWSPKVQFDTITDSVPPATPANTTWVVNGDSFHGEWDAVTTNTNGDIIPITRYEIELVGNSINKIVSVAPVIDNKNVFDLPFDQNTALFGGVSATVTFRVRSVDNKELKSAWSTLKTATNPAPANPTAFTATGGTGTIALKWTPPTDDDLVGYELFIGAAKIWEGDATAFTFQTTTYSSQTFTLKAVDKFQQRSSGVTASGTATSPFVLDTTPPTPPEWNDWDIQNHANGIGARAFLNWYVYDDDGDLSGSELRYREDVSGSWWSPVGTYAYEGESNTETYTDFPKASTGYVVQARTFDFSGNYSDWVEITMDAPSDDNPATPTGLAGTPTTTSITYHWNAVADEDIKNYVVDHSTGTFYTGTSTSITISGLTPGTLYTARVRADDIGGNQSGWTSSLGVTTLVYDTFLTDGNPPASSPTPTITSGIGYLHVSWTPVANNDLVTYEVHVSTSSGFTPSGGTKVGQTAGTQMSLEKDAAGVNLAYGTTYYVKLIAKDDDGAASAGSQASATLGQVNAGDTGFTVGGGNQQHDSSFESGSTGNWIPSGGSLAVSTTQAYRGTKSLRVTWPTAGAGTSVYDSAPITFPANQPVVESMYVYVPTGSPPVRLNLQYGSTQVLSKISTLNDTWERLSVSATPNVTGPVYVQAQSAGATTAGQFTYFDAVQIEQGDIPTAYAPSDYDTQTAAVTTANTNTTNAINNYNTTTVQPGLNGKNKIVRSSSTPSGSGYTQGDTWFQYSSGNLIGLWIYDGSTWQAQSLADTVLAGLNVGKLITGTLNATIITLDTGGVIQSNDYSAGTTGFKLTNGGLEINKGLIRAGALSVGIGGGNVLKNSNAKVIAAGIVEDWAGNNSILYNNTTYTRSASTSFMATSMFGGENYPFQRLYSGFGSPGEFVTISSYVLATASSRVARVYFNQLDAGGTILASSPGSDFNLSTTSWTRISGTFQLLPNVDRVEVYVACVRNTAVNEVFYFADAQYEIGDVLTAYSPKADEILPGTIIGNMIQADTSLINRMYIDATGSIQSTDYFAGSTGFKLTTGGLEIRNGVIAANTLVAGTGIVNNLVVGNGSSGTIQSYNYDSTHGFKLDSTGLIIRQGTVSADTFASGTVGGAAINIATGTSLVLNGGHERSNTYDGYFTVTGGTTPGTNYAAVPPANGSTYNGGTTSARHDPTAGFYLGNDGLVIAQGTVKAEAFAGGTFTAGTITIGSGGSISGYGGAFNLSSSGLTITNGNIEAAAIKLQVGSNIIPAVYADFESNSGFYSAGLQQTNATLSIDTTTKKSGTASLKAVVGGSAGTLYFGSNTAVANAFVVQPSTTYIFSFYYTIASGSTYQPSVVFRCANSAGTVTSSSSVNFIDTLTGASTLTADGTWRRAYAAVTTTATAVTATPQISLPASRTINIDNMQVEAKSGNINTPSPYSPPGSTSINGYSITTGQIISSATAQVWDSTPTGTSFNVTTTSGSATVTSSAGFLATDIGFGITGTGIPANAKIIAFANTSSVTISANATASGTVTGTVIRLPNGTYKNDPAGQPAWAIDPQGNAQFGKALVRGSLVIGDQYTTGGTAMASSQQAFVASSNYSPGTSGWMIRADGTSEFRSMAIGSFNGNAIAPNSLNADAINGGTISGTIVIGQEVITSQQQQAFKASWSSGGTTLTAVAGYIFYTDDIGITVTGTGIQAGTKITAVASGGATATISLAATAAGSSANLILYRGRQVRISGDGIQLKRADGMPIITLPTDPSKSASFTGSISTADLYVQDNFRMYGSSNSIAQGGTLGLAAGTYVPVTVPQITFDWVNQKTVDLTGADFTPSGNSYINYPVGLAYSKTTSNLYFVFDFFGTNVQPITQTTDVAGFSFNAPNLYGGNAMAPYGGISVDHAQSNVYILGYNKTYGNWAVHKIPKSQLDAGSITAAAGVANGWSPTSGGTPAPSGFPSIGARNNALYIAKIATNGSLYIEKWASWSNLGTGYSYSTAFPGFGTNASVVSVNVGTFDYGVSSTTPYVVITAILSSGFVYNWVFQDTGSAFVATNLDFQIPNSKSPIGTVWVQGSGTDNDDSTGHFETLTTDGYVFKYTGLGRQYTTNTMNAEQRWRGTGTGGTTLGIGPAGPNTGTISYVRRSRMTITSTSSIPNISPGPNSVSFYVGHDSGSLYRYYDPANGTSEPAIGVTSITVVDFQNSSASGTTASLNTGTAGQITGASGLFITGDGHAYFPGTGWLAINSTNAPSWGSGYTTWTDTTNEAPVFKRIGNTVYVRGLFQRSSGAGATIMTMPSTAKPSRITWRDINHQGAHGTVYIDSSSGNVIFYSTPTSGGYVNGQWLSFDFSYDINQP